LKNIKNMKSIFNLLIGALIIAMLLSILTALCMRAAFAGNTNDIINRERLRSEKIVKEVTKENGGFEKHKEISRRRIQEYQELVQSIKERHIKNARAKGIIKKAPQAVVFVSFSMPTLSLKQIIQDAAYYQIPVVVRGLYENSFRKTIERIFDLVKEDNKGGILINPVWFRKYDIKTVPAVVVSGGEVDASREEYKKNEKSGKNAGDGEFKKTDVVYGNIPLKRALTIIAERGEASKVAKDVLNRGGA
jgi:conjugal transfer pilus assembly protein TrbC